MATSQEKYIVRGLHHIGIWCDDVEACSQWYVDNLDFHLIHAQDGDVRCWFVENHGLVLEFVSNGTRSVNGRIDHIAIEVCGIEGLVEELKGKGIIAQDAEIVCNPDFFPSGIKNIFLDGPAGERLELFELVR